MLANERHKKIIDMLSGGGVTTAELVSKFGVSIETIRRDLLYLEGLGRLRRVHGGAVRAVSMMPYPTLDERGRSNAEGKRRLSARTAELVCDGDVIGIDSGSTAVYFAEALKDRAARATIITYSLDVFNILSGADSYKIILLGGQFLPEENAFVGYIPLNQLDNMHVGRAFVFPSALSVENGIADYNENICPLQSKLISAADEVYILADSTKFEKNAMIKIADASPDYVYVTDGGLDKNLYELLTERGYKIIV